MSEDLVGWFLALHRAVYFGLAQQIRAMDGDGTAAGPAAGLAFALGMLHALTPGHGKSIIFFYFLGSRARPLAGMAMALKIAATHVGSALVLVSLAGAAVMMLGRPTGAAVAMQNICYAAVTLVGAWLLYRALRPQNEVSAAPESHGDHRHGGALPFAVGLLPCPMTMLVMTYATANATLIGGVLLVGILGLGITMTIGLFGTLAILARHGVFARFDPEHRWFALTTRALEIISAAFVLLAGGLKLAGSLA